MAPFLFENWFRYRLQFFFGLPIIPIGCQKVLMLLNVHCRKYWLVEKSALNQTSGLDIGCKFPVFSDLVNGWWSKLRARHPYPTQIWVPLPGLTYTSWNMFDKIRVLRSVQGLCCSSSLYCECYPLDRNSIIVKRVLTIWTGIWRIPIQLRHVISCRFCLVKNCSPCTAA